MGPHPQAVLRRVTVELQVGEEQRSCTLVVKVTLVPPPPPQVLPTEDLQRYTRARFRQVLRFSKEVEVYTRLVTAMARSDLLHPCIWPTLASLPPYLLACKLPVILTFQTRNLSSRVQLVRPVYASQTTGISFFGRSNSGLCQLSSCVQCPVKLIIYLDDVFIFHPVSLSCVLCPV